MSGACPHDDGARAKPRAAACESCGMDHQLRVCARCGHVGCADSNEGHATAHARSSGHPVFMELTAEASPWAWCDRCRTYLP